MTVIFHCTWCLLIPPSAPARPSPTSLDVDSKPTMRDLERHVVRRAASKWELLARSLGVKESLISIVKRDHSYSCEEACRDILNRWLNGDCSTGDEERSLQSVMTAIEEIEVKETN